MPFLTALLTDEAEVVRRSHLPLNPPLPALSLAPPIFFMLEFDSLWDPGLAAGSGCLSRCRLFPMQGLSIAKDARKRLLTLHDNDDCSPLHLAILNGE